MSSRWATSNDEDREIDVQRKKQKQEKQEKRRLKEEIERKNAEKLLVQQLAEKEERSAERQRTATPTREGAHVLEFPASTYASCRSLDTYEVLNNIEEGSYGFVSRARMRTTGEIVALKRLKMDSTNEGFPVTGLREIHTLRACSHQHIVNIREVVIGPAPVQDVYIVMDFLEHDLKDLLQDMDDPFSPSEVKTILRQICSATEYLHANWIIHRDLKTSNLLLNNRGELKIADFGMARYTANPPPKLTQLVVTLWYRAPELLLGAREYGFEIDIWSIGCIFSELLSREPVFQGKNEVTQLSAIFSLLGTPSVKSWPDFKSLPNSKALSPLLSTARSASQLTSTRYPYLTNAGLQLLSAMLTMNPKSRPSASDILAHPYFKEDPRPKPTEMLPTFPSKAGGERRRRRRTPQAPDRGEAPKFAAEDFARVLEQNLGPPGVDFGSKSS